jgi:hypothetical protein
LYCCVERSAVSSFLSPNSGFADTFLWVSDSVYAISL